MEDKDQVIATEQELRNEIPVPSSFETEKGSNYEYFADGSGYVVRSKYDGTDHVTRGVTVFVDEDAMIDASRMSAEQDHLPKERKRTPYLFEDLGDHGDYVFEPIDIKNPDNLVLAILDGNGNVIKKHKASLTPQLGNYPFQQSYKKDVPNRHLGDKVTKIESAQQVRIRYGGNAAIP